MSTAFISYSWDSDDHKKWVRDLATRLRGKGITIKLDQWHLVPGDPLPLFMETAVRESDHVLVVCTRLYKERSDNRKGGVGYEGGIMSAEVMNIGNQRKFIPVRRSGALNEALPTWLAGNYCVDLSDNPYSETNFNDLTSTLLGTHPKAPPVATKTASAHSPAKSVAVTPAPVGALAFEPPRTTSVVPDDIGTPRNDGTRVVSEAAKKLPFDDEAQHESGVRTQLGFDSQKQKEDELLAGYVEEWGRRLNLDDWKAWASGIMSYGLPTLGHGRKVALEDTRQWLLSRVWLPRYPELDAAFANFRVVTQDFCLVFNEYAEHQGDEWRTRKFYQLGANWNNEKERRLMRRFDGHVGLVQDLMVELTRAVNYVCDEVRRHLLPAFRVAEGLVLLEGGPYSSFEFKTYRLEYSASERTGVPYPGLGAFKTARFSRTIHFGHESDEV